MFINSNHTPVSGGKKPKSPHTPKIPQKFAAVKIKNKQIENWIQARDLTAEQKKSLLKKLNTRKAFKPYKKQFNKIIKQIDQYKATDKTQDPKTFKTLRRAIIKQFDQFIQTKTPKPKPQPKPKPKPKETPKPQPPTTFKDEINALLSQIPNATEEQLQISIKNLSTIPNLTDDQKKLVQDLQSFTFDNQEDLNQTITNILASYTPPINAASKQQLTNEITATITDHIALQIANYDHAHANQMATRLDAIIKQLQSKELQTLFPNQTIKNETINRLTSNKTALLTAVGVNMTNQQQKQYYQKIIPTLREIRRALQASSEMQNLNKTTDELLSLNDPVQIKNQYVILQNFLHTKLPQSEYNTSEIRKLDKLISKLTDRNISKIKSAIEKTIHTISYTHFNPVITNINPTLPDLGQQYNNLISQINELHNTQPTHDAAIREYVIHGTQNNGGAAIPQALIAGGIGTLAVPAIASRRDTTHEFDAQIKKRAKQNLDVLNKIQDFINDINTDTNKYGFNLVPPATITALQNPLTAAHTDVEKIHEIYSANPVHHAAGMFSGANNGAGTIYFDHIEAVAIAVLDADNSGARIDHTGNRNRIPGHIDNAGNALIGVHAGASVQNLHGINYQLCDNAGDIRQPLDALKTLLSQYL